MNTKYSSLSEEAIKLTNIIEKDKFRNNQKEKNLPPNNTVNKKIVQRRKIHAITELTINLQTHTL